VNVELMIRSSERSNLKRPLYFVETGFNQCGDAVSQKITALTKGEVECIAYVDYGDKISLTEHRAFPTFRSMVRATHKRIGTRSKNLLRSEMFEQLERRLLGMPYLPPYDGDEDGEEETEAIQDEECEGDLQGDQV
jgi:hypothetical protein